MNLQTKTKNITSFIKWPGGKRWFISRFKSILPTDCNHYFEPFVGGGSVFFHIAHQLSTISDINTDLINLYCVMRDAPELLKKSLQNHQMMHCKDYYYQVRDTNPDSIIERASRFLYLNRTCYNGMYRVNKNGKFNVPIGTKNNCIYDIDLFMNYSELLKDTKIEVNDFGSIIKRAYTDDFIFADPPYTIAHNQNSFIKYNENLFSWNDQIRLLNELYCAKLRGATIISTNANYNELHTMYADHGFHVLPVSRNSTVSGSVKSRKKTEELLITSFKLSNLRIG